MVQCKEKQMYTIINCLQEWEDFQDVHKIKSTSGGKEISMIPLILFSDDASGNRSKKWNCFNIWAMMLAGLPHEENAKLHNIHLIAASNKVS